MRWLVVVWLRIAVQLKHTYTQAHTHAHGQVHIAPLTHQWIGFMSSMARLAPHTRAPAQPALRARLWLKQHPPLVAAVVVSGQLARHAPLERSRACVLALVFHNVRRVGLLPHRAHAETLHSSHDPASRNRLAGSPVS